MKVFIYSEQQNLFGKRIPIGYGGNELYIKLISRNFANDLIVSNHYSHKYYAGSYIHLGIFNNNEIFGVLQYGYAMNPASQQGVVSDTAQDEYLELNRMWVNDCLPRNSESMAISYSIKYIKQAYPKIKWIQSFADERCNRFGVVYQAANFLYCGEHTSIFWQIDNEWFHNSLMTRNPKLSKAAAYIQLNRNKATSFKLRQFRYIYFIHKGSRKNLKLRIQNYPKHYAAEVSREIRPKFR